MHSYNHNIKTFNSATMHLTRVERALYRDLIELYYDTEQPLPSVDFNRLARRVRATDEQELIALQYVLDEFFILTGDSYSHDFCDEQIDKFHNTTTLKAKAGKASAEARKKKAEARKSVRKNTNEQVLNTCSTEGQQNPTNHEPVTSNHEPLTIKDKTLVEPKHDESEFDQQWTAYGKKGNRKTSLQKFKKLNDKQILSLKNHLPQYVQSTPETKYRKNFESYLNQECWNDEVAATTHDKHSGFKDRDYNKDATKSEDLSWMQ
jgi:uncharacterized protein YdaU (DUF1376 family)